MDDKILDQYDGFQRDIGNIDKKLIKHNISNAECEEAFFNKPFIIKLDENHLQEEARYYILGKINEDRKLFLVFTTRNSLIRVISARDMNKKERTVYDDEKKIPHFKNESEEREFWAAHDSTEYIDWNKASVA
ncbi:MAG: hypothetical protein EVG15_10750, partial [Candidatus Acididesulfobacter diazotrophicus]